VEVVVGKRVRDFSQYAEPLGRDFVSKLADGWRAFADQCSEESERSYWHHNSRFLNFLSNDDRLEALREFFRKEQDLSSAQEYLSLQNALSLYRDTLSKDESLSGVSRNNLVAGVSSFFVKWCADQGVVPQELYLAGFKINTGLRGGTTVLDERLLSLLAVTNEDLEKTLSVIEDSDAGLDEDVVQLILSLSKGRESNGAASGFSLELAVRTLNGRVEALCTASRQLYFEYIQATKEAKQWLQSPEICELADALQAALTKDWGASGAQAAGREYTRILGSNPTAVITTFLHRHNDSRMLLDSDLRSKRLWKPDKMKRLDYDQDTIRLHLGVDPLRMVSGYAFILLETAGNTSSIWNLSINDLNNMEGGYQLNWIKWRSQGDEAKYKLFAERDPSAELTADTLTVRDVYKHELEQRARFIGDVRPEDKDALFLAHYKNHTKVDATRRRQYVPSRPSENFARSHFQTLCNIASNGQWTTTPKAIRGSLMLLTGLMTRDAGEVARLGQHKGLSMAARYTFELPELMRRESAVREFLSWFETLLTIDIQDFALRIGIDPVKWGESLDEVKALRTAELNEAVNNQFGGVHCIDPKAGVQPGTEKGEVCDRVENCLTCPHRRSLFVLSDGNLVNVIHWHAELKAAKEKLSEEAFAPWSLWLLFTSMILDKFSNARIHARLVRQAQARAAKESNPYAGIFRMKEVK